MGAEEDLPYGRGLREAMRPFAAHLLASGLKARTVRRHLDNLRLLGGEIVRKVGLEGTYDIPPQEAPAEAVDETGGPHCRHLHTEAEADAYDATCRKLHRFLKAHSQ
jgi:hypothetical protein